MFKVVIFDLVGVFSKHENIYQIFKKITNHKGTAESLKSYIGESYEKLLTGKINELIFWNKLKKVTESRKKIDSLKKNFFSSFKPLFKAESFNKTRAVFKVALCSNFVNSWWLYLENKLNIHFDYVVLSSSFKAKKPDSSIYLSVPNFFKLSPQDCAYVSDEEEDMKAAKSLGMQTIFIPGKSKNYRGADYIYNNVQELLEVLN